MSYKIAIASGKGGTGKTTVAVNLYHFFTNNLKYRTILADCDVEEPNDTLFFSDYQKTSEKEVYQLISEINTDACTFCRKCAEYCEFNAIVVIPPLQFAEINPDLCHSCGACSVACKDNAITEKKLSIGTIRYFKNGGAGILVEGRLRIGSAMQTMLIKEVKKELAPDTADLVIFDAPPGTSCSVVATVSDAEYIILVSEPTPFGLHDLKLMVELLKDIKKPFGLVVNKAGLGNRDIYKYIDNENIELLGEIPFDRDYAAKYARGNLFVNISENITAIYRSIAKKLEKQIIGHEGADYFKW